jgi:hypothetical protein
MKRVFSAYGLMLLIITHRALNSRQGSCRAGVSGFILFFLSIGFFSSCSKEDNKDIIAPVITSVNFSMNDTIRNSYNIKIDATDNNTIDRMELYANDSLIATVNMVPFEFLWNTNKVKDGKYSIKAIVYDIDGNKAESTYNVIVQNALLTINLGSEYHAPFRLVISDEEGNILKSVTVQGTGKVSIMPLYPLENNAINVVYCNTGTYSSIVGFVHVKRGSEFNMDWSSIGPVVKGVKLHLKNDIASFSRIWISTDWAQYQITTMADTTTLPNTIPYSTGHKLLLQIETNEGRFYKFLTVDNIGEITLKLSDITTSMNVKSYSVPPTRSSSYLIMGIGNDKDSINRYYISQGYSALNENHLNFLYPAEYFSRYYTYVSYSPDNDNNKHYSNIYQGAIPERFDPLTATFAITSPKADNFKANISGDFDYYQVSYRNNPRTISFTVSAPVNHKEWKLPDLTIAFDNPDFKFDNFEWENVFLINHESLDWSNKYYDLSLKFEKVNYYAKYTQSVWIYNPLIEPIGFSRMPDQTGEQYNLNSNPLMNSK